MRRNSNMEVAPATIHNVDQKAPVVRLAHPSFTTASKTVEVAQCSAGTAGFKPNTSSVLWACGRRLADHLIARPELVAGKRCVELGAGIGLTGTAAAALGAAMVLLTDVESGMPLLRANAEAADATLARPNTLRAQELLWGEEAHIETALAGGPYDVVLGADILYWQGPEDVGKLVQTMEAMLAPGGVVLLAYEWREDWETTGHFHAARER